MFPNFFIVDSSVDITAPPPNFAAGIDASWAGSALTFLSGGMWVMHDRRPRKTGF